MGIVKSLGLGLCKVITGVAVVAGGIILADYVSTKMKGE